MGKAIICDYCRKITSFYKEETEYHVSGSSREVKICVECHNEYFKSEMNQK